MRRHAVPDAYEAIWAELGLDLERYAQLRAAGPQPFREIVLSRELRPAGMGYFDDLMRGLHTTRVKELYDFRRDGGKVVGIFCVFVPEDLILAAGAIPVALCAGSPFPLGAAETVLPMNTCALVKAAYGFELERICPYSLLSDLIVGETTCDGKKKMYELFGRLRDIFVMEVPQRKTDQGMALFNRELDELRGVLEYLTGNEVTAESLADATALHEAKRAAMQRIADTRRAPLPPISGVDALFLNQLSFIDDTARFTAAANSLAEELEDRVAAGEGAYPGKRPRILVTGCPMALPNWKVPNLIETCGGAVVAEESCIGSRYYEPRVAGKAPSLPEQLSALAQRQLETHCASFTPNDERVDDILRLVEEYHADGVIQYTLQFCHTFAHEAVKVDQALAEAGVPSLKVETDYSPQDAAQLKLRVQAFLEMIG
jgi:benzoyl-CoA reductase/2-hydroxyglutaryl-CoA dehydratase subunit BcrC/BadD/HgdB